MGNVYFLGAGFSAAYGLPIMNQFFTFAKRSRLIEPEEKRFLAEVQRFAHIGVRLITISRNNMEEILSFLEMAEQAGQIPQQIKDLSKIGEKPVSPMELLRSIIARVYGPLPADLLGFERPIIEWRSWTKCRLWRWSCQLGKQSVCRRAPRQHIHAY
jgi:hypothetical protein